MARFKSHRFGGNTCHKTTLLATLAAGSLDRRDGATRRRTRPLP